MAKENQPAEIITSCNEKITILIIEDHALIRETWGAMLGNVPGFAIVALCGTAEEALETIKTISPAVVILDINLPGMNGLDATKHIHLLSPASKILGVSINTHLSYVKTMMRNGASGFVTKNSTCAEFIQAIIEIHRGNTFICAEIKNLLSDQLIGEKPLKAGLQGLSRRELQCIGFIRQGLSTREIGCELHISPKTVETLRYNIFKKLNLKKVTSLLQLVNCSDLEFTS